MQQPENLEIENDIEIIRLYDIEQSGTADDNNGKVSARLEKVDTTQFLYLDEIVDMDPDETDFRFVTDKSELIVNTSIIAHRNTIDTELKTSGRYSEAKAHSFRTVGFDEEATAYFRHPLRARALVYFVPCTSFYHIPCSI